MKKNILIVIDENVNSQQLSQWAINRAKNTGSHISAITIIPQEQIESLKIGAPAGAIHYAMERVDEILHQTQEKANRVIDNFKEIAKEISYSTKILSGSPAKIISQQSIYSDLVILPSKINYYMEEYDDYLSDIKDILSQGSCPTLIIPENVKITNKTVFTIDGKLQSANALKAYIQMSKFIVDNYKEVKLYNINDEIADGMKILSQAEEYLTIKGYKVIKMVKTSDDVPEGMMEIVEENPHATTVLGAYGSSKIENFFFGSSATQLIKNIKTPLFFFH